MVTGSDSTGNLIIVARVIIGSHDVPDAPTALYSGLCGKAFPRPLLLIVTLTTRQEFLLPLFHFAQKLRQNVLYTLRRTRLYTLRRIDLRERMIDIFLCTVKIWLHARRSSSALRHSVTILAGKRNGTQQSQALLFLFQFRIVMSGGNRLGRLSCFGATCIRAPAGMAGIGMERHSLGGCVVRGGTFHNIRQYVVGQVSSSFFFPCTVFVTTASSFFALNFLR